MHPTVVVNVVSLTGALLGDETPNLTRLAREGACVPLETVTPAVTSTVQSTFLTGDLARGHGVVGNGWYFRDLAQVAFWRQSNLLVGGEKLWDVARRRDARFTCASMFWWFNMYGRVEYSVTPRPIYPADGRKIPAIYSQPRGLQARLVSELGEFPFFHFWGPQADIRSSEWIAEATVRVCDWHAPTLALVYLPHLDYPLQRLGPDHPDVRHDLGQIDRICGTLVERLRETGRRIILLSEYGITKVTAPIHINRVLREAGLVEVRSELGTEMLDPGASQAFAVADHQIAHIYVRDSDRIAEVRSLLESVPGIETLLDRHDQAAYGLDHPRSGELVAIARSDRWFTYYYWLDDRQAPDFARTVDIHRKPGYDPAELFVDPRIRFPTVKTAAILLRKTLGFRYLMSLIPLDAGLVRGSHGRLTDEAVDGPLLMSTEPDLIRDEVVHATAVKDLILSHLF